MSDNSWTVTNCYIKSQKVYQQRSMAVK